LKVGVAIYYCNPEQYPKQWRDKCFDSLKNQTYKDFKSYSLDYGWDGNFSSTDITRFVKLKNYAEAMNYIYSWIFETCDVAVNVNIDDYYAPERIELLLKEIESGADVASSNYHIIDEDDNIIHSTQFEKLDVNKELRKWNKIVSNPAHLMSKKVWDSGFRFNPELVPIEDLHAWREIIQRGFVIKIHPAYLHYYRQHSLQATKVYTK